VFDPGRLLVVRVGNLNDLTNELIVFDPGCLLVVRVGNLNDLTNELIVFDPGRLLVVRVGNLNDYESEIEERCIVENPSFYSLNLGCLVKTSLAKTLLREKRPGEEKEYTQGYKYLV